MRMAEGARDELVYSRGGVHGVIRVAVLGKLPHPQNFRCNSIAVRFRAWKIILVVLPEALSQARGRQLKAAAFLK